MDAILHFPLNHCIAYLNLDDADVSDLNYCGNRHAIIKTDSPSRGVDLGRQTHADVTHANDAHLLYLLCTCMMPVHGLKALVSRAGPRKVVTTVAALCACCAAGIGMADNATTASDDH